MTGRDDFADLIAARLRAAAPQEAPAHLMNMIVNRVASTPQRGRGSFSWLASPGVRLAAAAVVIAVAVLAGTQFGGLFGRPTGADPSPESSASAAPSGSTATSSGSAAPSSSEAHSPAPSDAAADDLILRLKLTGDTSFGPNVMPEFTLIGDGTVVWLPEGSGDGTTGLVTRQLTPDGLSELRDIIFGSGFLDESASYELEPRPDAPEPPGHGVTIYTFTRGAAEGDDPIVVRSVQWLGDEEAAYYQPAPEREELDALAQRLRDPESLLGEDAWAGAAEAYQAPDYQLVLRLNPDVPSFGSTDASEIRWPFDGPLQEFGEQTGPLTNARCGIVSADGAAPIVADLADADGLAGMAMVSTAQLDWAEGSGTVDVFVIPRMPDAYPACEDLP